MMQEIRVKVKDFDLESFIHETFNFLKTVVDGDTDPSYAVAWLREDDGKPDYGLEDQSRDHQEELLEERKILFFPFSTCNTGVPIICADGEEYELVELFEQDPDEDYEEFRLSDQEVLGYLIKVEAGEIVINSAIHGGGDLMLGSYIRIVYDCDILEEPLREFITHYISE
jgi:hypothetical protein